MKISAQLHNSYNKNEILLQTNENVQSIVIPSKKTGFGSSVNGGELLFLGLATCYCNDIYREAAKKGIKISSVEVFVTGEFDGEGQPAKNISYSAKLNAEGNKDEILKLMRYTDTVSEIQNTLRKINEVKLSKLEVTKNH